MCRQRSGLVHGCHGTGGNECVDDLTPPETCPVTPSCSVVGRGRGPSYLVHWTDESDDCIEKCLSRKQMASTIVRGGSCGDPCEEP